MNEMFGTLFNQFVQSEKESLRKEEKQNLRK
jgi:hypothetical protein